MKTLLLLLIAATCYGMSDQWINGLADSIYKAEGGTHTSHPYGIMVRYKHTTPRQACINTIKTNLRHWNHIGCFIDYMAPRYCMDGTDNWRHNVSYFMREKGLTLNPD